MSTHTLYIDRRKADKEHTLTIRSARQAKYHSFYVFGGDY